MRARPSHWTTALPCWLGPDSSPGRSAVRGGVPCLKHASGIRHWRSDPPRPSANVRGVRAGSLRSPPVRADFWGYPQGTPRRRPGDDRDRLRSNGRFLADALHELAWDTGLMLKAAWRRRRVLQGTMVALTSTRESP